MTETNAVSTAPVADAALHATDGRLVADVIKGQRVICMPLTTSIRKASEVMAMLEMGALPITDGQQLVGIFTERDALKKVLAKGRDPETTLVKHVMTATVCTIDATAKISEALVLMKDNRFRHLPVVDGDEVQGIVSIRDLLQ